MEGNKVEGDELGSGDGRENFDQEPLIERPGKGTSQPEELKRALHHKMTILETHWSLIGPIIEEIKSIKERIGAFVSGNYENPFSLTNSLSQNQNDFNRDDSECFQENVSVNPNYFNDFRNSKGEFRNSSDDLIKPLNQSSYIKESDNNLNIFDRDLNATKNKGLNISSVNPELNCAFNVFSAEQFCGTLNVCDKDESSSFSNLIPKFESDSSEENILESDNVNFGDGETVLALQSGGNEAGKCIEKPQKRFLDVRKCMCKFDNFDKYVGLPEKCIPDVMECICKFDDVGKSVEGILDVTECICKFYDVGKAFKLPQKRFPDVTECISMTDSVSQMNTDDFSASLPVEIESKSCDESAEQLSPDSIVDYLKIERVFEKMLSHLKIDLICPWEYKSNGNEGFETEPAVGSEQSCEIVSRERISQEFSRSHILKELNICQGDALDSVKLMRKAGETSRLFPSHPGNSLVSLQQILLNNLLENVDTISMYANNISQDFV